MKVMSTATQTKTPAKVGVSLPEISVKATAAMIVAYCAAIVAGMPATGIFGTKLSNVVMTDEQRQQIRAARKQHRDESKANKRAVISFVARKGIDLVGHRKNAKVTKHVLRFEDTAKLEAEKSVKAKKVKAVKPVTAPVAEVQTPAPTVA